jgi:hypothetical protein
MQTHRIARQTIKPEKPQSAPVQFAAAGVVGNATVDAHKGSLWPVDFP